MYEIKKQNTSSSHDCYCQTKRRPWWLVGLKKGGGFDGRRGTKKKDGGKEKRGWYWSLVRNSKCVFTFFLLHLFTYVLNHHPLINRVNRSNLMVFSFFFFYYCHDAITLTYLIVNQYAIHEFEESFHDREKYRKIWINIFFLFFFYYSSEQTKDGLSLLIHGESNDCLDLLDKALVLLQVRLYIDRCF